MKRFKNVCVGTTADFATITVNGASDPTLAVGVKLLPGMVFINEESGIIWTLSKIGAVAYWIRTDNNAATGYNA